LWWFEAGFLLLLRKLQVFLYSSPCEGGGWEGVLRAHTFCQSTLQLFDFALIPHPNPHLCRGGGLTGVIPARHLPDFKVTPCKSIQPISFAKWQEYSRFAAAKSVAGLGTPNIWN